MKFAYGLSAALLGTTLLAGAATAAHRDDNSQPSHPHFTARGHEDVVRTTGQPTGRPQYYTPPPHGTPNAGSNATATMSTNTGNYHRGGNPNWQHGNNFGNHPNYVPHPHWNANNLGDHNVSHFSAQDRSTWQRGHWKHGHHHGRNGWWWNSGGTWFFYDQPVYPYPGYVSDTYYDDDYYDDGGDNGYGDPGYGASPGDSGYYWYYCNNPAGYYPYVKSCRGPWRAVTPTPDPQQGYDQGSDTNDDEDQGPPPGYSNNGPQDRDQYNGPDNGDQGPPPGYNNDDRGPPGGNTPDDEDDDNGPPR